MNEIELKGRLAAMASRVTVDDRLSDVVNEVSYAAVTPLATRRRAPMVVALAGLAAAVLAGVVIARRDSGERQSPAPAVGAQPAPATTVARNPFIRTEHFPLLDEADVPIQLVDGLFGGFGVSEESDVRAQALIAGPAETPTEVISVTAFPGGGFQPEPFPESVIGRRPDVHETQWGSGGGTTLQWGDSAMQFSMVGSNLDVMYALLELIVPVSSGPTRFEFNGQLPGGLRLVGDQIEGKAGATPNISGAEGEISVSIENEGVFTLVVGQKITRTTVAGRPAWLFHEQGRAPTLAVEIAPRETLMIYGHTLTLEQLLAMAEKVQVVDEATWRTYYGVTDYVTGSDDRPVTIAAAPVVTSVSAPATTAVQSGG